MPTRRTIHLLATLLGLCAAALRSALAHDGWGIVVDPQGQVYFTDIPANTIWKVTADGRLTAAVRGKHSHALVLDHEDNVYGPHDGYPEPTRNVRQSG